MKKLFLYSVFLVLCVYALSMIEFKEVDNNNFSYEQNKFIRVKRNETGNIEVVPFEKYIVGVVAGEMPVSFEVEALKAQAVAARSYALTKMNQNKNNTYDVVDTISNQVYLDDSKLRKKWGNTYNKNIEKIKNAVFETRGEYLVYNEEVVNAFFFSTSVGKTENCVDVFGGNLPYLVSVDSHWDEDVSPVFSVEKVISLDDFYKYLNMSYSKTLNIDVLNTTSTGRIKKVSINGKSFTGSEVANKLSLRSAFFKINKKGDDVIIDTLGYGHGVGMSQYGALGMAKEGYSYEDILFHYYTGVELRKN